MWVDFVRMFTSSFLAWPFSVLDCDCTIVLVLLSAAMIVFVKNAGCFAPVNRLGSSN